MPWLPAEMSALWAARLLSAFRLSWIRMPKTTPMSVCNQKTASIGSAVEGVLVAKSSNTVARGGESLPLRSTSALHVRLTAFPTEEDEKSQLTAQPCSHTGA